MRGRKVNNVKFIEMWDMGAPASEIAEKFGIKRQSVYWKRIRLGLARRNLTPKQRRIATENKVFDYLKNHDGYASRNRLYSITATIASIWQRNKLIRIYMSMNKGTGSFKRNINKYIFNNGFHGKVYFCLDRTAVVRLMQKALKQPKDENIQKSISQFLKKYLTDAEKFAVLWHLGVRHYHHSRVKSSIQIDGVVKAKR